MTKHLLPKPAERRQREFVLPAREQALREIGPGVQRLFANGRAGRWVCKADQR